MNQVPIITTYRCKQERNVKSFMFRTFSENIKVKRKKKKEKLMLNCAIIIPCKKFVHLPIRYMFIHYEKEKDCTKTIIMFSQSRKDSLVEEIFH